MTRARATGALSTLAYALRDALETFERLGAVPWAERARAELRASGETARRRAPDAAGALTPQERQIARFVAAGATNKEVAAQLFVSPRTVDHHLRNGFAKLGITGRGQLREVDLVGWRLHRCEGAPAPRG